MGELILVLGGARSGKSSYADRLARAIGGERVLYVATAEAGDEEMRARIRMHRESRPRGWRTFETPTGVAAALRQAAQDARVILLDCVTLWVANVLLSLGEEPDAQAAEAAMLREVEELLDVVSETDATLIAVSNEVGLGVVPPYALGRLYRDLLGRVNQLLAARAGQVILTVAGLPIDVKRLPMAWPLVGQGDADASDK
ncbi:MAG: bifunctional adenosylcobinamide kinase/adenosylcobinamide-phosphate guanylyltransferase [Chloroflexi bacterium]|nr:bifunctional adenosylcobinamide kinase/adenosylcobinamide-phosphate guanylyltransferase [Chloroflexota bacterium]